MTSAFISDGYTLEATIPEKPGLWPEITFHYRPAIGLRARQYFAAYKGGPEAEEKADIALLTSQLVDWSFDEPIDAPHLKALWHPIIVGMVNNVLGYAIAQADAEAKN